MGVLIKSAYIVDVAYHEIVAGEVAIENIATGNNLYQSRNDGEPYGIATDIGQAL